MKAQGTYKVKKWEENQYAEISSNMKMAKASVEYSFEGEIEGDAFMEYLMYYKYYDSIDPHKSSAVYTGLMRFEGKLHGKEGSFVIADQGKFENGLAESSLQIINGSGMGELKGISGTGKYSADKDGAQFKLEYDL